MPCNQLKQNTIGNKHIHKKQYYWQYSPSLKNENGNKVKWERNEMKLHSQNDRNGKKKSAYSRKNGILCIKIENNFQKNASHSIKRIQFRNKLTARHIAVCVYLCVALIPNVNQVRSMRTQRTKKKSTNLHELRLLLQQSKVHNGLQILLRVDED